MKKTIPCTKCEICAVGYSIGFTGEKTYRCSRLNDYVTAEDGCTMGVKGEPGTLCFDCDIDISANATVWGYEVE